MRRFDDSPVILTTARQVQLHEKAAHTIAFMKQFSARQWNDPLLSAVVLSTELEDCLLTMQFLQDHLCFSKAEAEELAFAAQLPLDIQEQMSRKQFQLLYVTQEPTE